MHLGSATGSKIDAHNIPVLLCRTRCKILPTSATAGLLQPVQLSFSLTET